jgi:hypothetical protein
MSRLEAAVRMALLNKSIFQPGEAEEALAAWRPAKTAKTGAHGKPREYSDLAIETELFICQVFHLQLCRPKAL